MPLEDVMTFNLSNNLITRSGCNPKEYTLYRKIFEADCCDKAFLNVFANGIYKIYLNGLPVLKSGASAEPKALSFNNVDISDFLMSGENVLAVIVYCETAETLPPTSIALEIIADSQTLLKSDDTFLTSSHSGFAKENCFDSRTTATEFEYPDYDDSSWETAEIAKTDGIIIEAVAQNKDEQPIKPKSIGNNKTMLTVDFGKKYNGCLYIEATGKSGDELELLFDQKHSLKWILSGGYDTLCETVPHDFKAVNITFPIGASVNTESITLLTNE